MTSQTRFLFGFLLIAALAFGLFDEFLGIRAIVDGAYNSGIVTVILSTVGLVAVGLIWKERKRIEKEI